jgi:type II secretion system protein N
MKPAHENRKVFFYLTGFAFYGIVLYCIFIVLTFPKKKVEHWILFQFQNTTRTRIAVEETHFVFPLGTEWRRVTVTPSDKPETRFEVDQMNVDFSFPSFLFKRKMDARFHLKGWGGGIRGSWAAEKGEKNTSHTVAVEGEDLELKKFPWNKGIAMEGKVRFQTEYRWDETAPSKGKGYLNFEGKDINVRGFSAGGFALPETGVSRVNGHCMIRDGSMTLDRFELAGSLADINGTGTLILEVPFQKTVLNLSMKLIPKEALNQVIPLAFLAPGARPGTPMDLFLKGTVDLPAFTLKGPPL